MNLSIIETCLRYKIYLLWRQKRSRKQEIKVSYFKILSLHYAIYWMIVKMIKTKMPSVPPLVKFTILCYLKYQGQSSLTFCYFCINLAFELSFSHNYCSVSLIFFTFLKFSSSKYGSNRSVLPVYQNKYRKMLKGKLIKLTLSSFCLGKDYTTIHQ